MGLFSSIKKGIKSVFRGVKKVFSKVGKALDSKWGKALMVGMAIFTGGMALAAGFQGFTATSGTFLTKFVAGAKAFVGALANPIKQAKSMMSGAGAGAQAAGAGAQTAGAAGEVLASGGASVATDAMTMATGTGAQSAGAQAAGAASAAPGSVAAAAASNPGISIGGGGVTTAADAAAAKAVSSAGQGGWLSQAAAGAMDFAKSAGGGMIIKGYAEGAYQEELMKEAQKERRYYDNAWKDPEQLNQLHSAVNRDINVPQGYNDRRQRENQSVRQAPSVAFDANAQPAQYAYNYQN